MRKLLLGLGAITAIVAPVATIVACGNTGHKLSNHKTELKNLLQNIGLTNEQVKDLEQQIDSAKSSAEADSLYEAHVSDFEKANNSEAAKEFKKLSERKIKITTFYDSWVAGFAAKEGANSEGQKNWETARVAFNLDYEKIMKSNSLDEINTLAKDMEELYNLGLFERAMQLVDNAAVSK